MSADVSLLWLWIFSSPAVDKVRESLESTSAHWFRWMVISSVVVGIGVILEAPEATIALKRWFRLRSGEEVVPENDRSIVIPISYIGLLLVVLGVAGEGIFEFLSSNAETSLRAHDEQILSETEGKFGQVKDSAEAAAKAAGTAELSAGKADKSAREASLKSEQAATAAGSATMLAKSARQEADSFEKDISSAKEQAAKAESHLAEAMREAADAKSELDRFKAPRFLTDNQMTKIISSMKPLGPSKIDFFIYPNDGEAMGIAEQVAKCLPGWTLKGVSPLAGTVQGMLIEYDPSDPQALTRAKALFDSLSESGLKVAGPKPTLPTPPNQLPAYLGDGPIVAPIRLTIGKK